VTPVEVVTKKENCLVHRRWTTETQVEKSLLVLPKRAKEGGPGQKRLLGKDVHD
jgi:hypothetical protein